MLRRLIFFVSLFACSQASAQTPPSPSTLPELLTEIKNVMQQEQMPGLMLSIVAKDSVVFSGGLGMAVVETGQQVNGKTLFHLSSINKMCVALGVLKLVEEGKLRLEDKLSDIAPEVHYENSWEGTHPVRVVQLLEHSTGFDDSHLNMVYNTTATNLTGLAAVRFYQTCLVSRWQPGLASSYANANYALLGYLIERYSGMRWDNYLQQVLLKPLGMHTSDFDVRIKKPEKYARGYRVENGTYRPFPFYVPAGNGAHGTLHSCAEDMTRFLLFFLADWQVNGKPWLAASYLSAMETIHSTAAAKAGLQTGYALGNSTFYNHPKANFRGHAGGGDGFESLFNYDRQRRIGYAIANNGGKGMWRISVLVENFLTKDLPPFISVAVPRKIKPVFLNAFVGYYKPLNIRSEQWDFIQRIIRGVHFSQWKDKIIIKPFLGQPDTLEWERGMLFKRKNERHASVVLITDSLGKNSMQAYTHQYYEQTAYLPVLLEQLFFALSALAVVAASLWTVVWLLLIISNKISRNLYLVGVLPGLAVSAGIIAYRVMTVTDYENKIAFNSINPASLTIFLLSLFFGIFTMAALGMLVKQWSQVKSPWVRGVLAFNAFFLTYLTVVLLTHGWIGVRVWAL
ncbi:beta-lactamase family protein [Hymenobacter tibetensis]|uniref:Beta-lactamase family protein n=1 Tax=Hymenobacter tibetensis TaxID=497967 RepID=A0ABY4CU02_9BACT|nr:serine hydrolase domain-containing protein [Hymenobacter tibetensis]UOG73591.1 beta-lactamase family protein [Hymenobacter tibetensis]